MLKFVLCLEVYEEASTILGVYSSLVKAKGYASLYLYEHPLADNEVLTVYALYEDKTVLSCGVEGTDLVFT